MSFTSSIEVGWSDVISMTVVGSYCSFRVSIPLEYCRKKPDLGLQHGSRADAKDLKVLDEMRIIAKNNTASCISAIHI